MKNDLWEAVWLSGLLTLHSPCLECNGQNLQGHDECRETQANGEGEHRIDIVIFHGLDDVTSLPQVSIFIISLGVSLMNVVFTYAHHKDKTSRHEAEGSNDLGRWPSGQV